MAAVNGSSANDFIHRAGDGQTAPAGYEDVDTATTTGDTIRGLAGDDIYSFDPAVDGPDLTDLGEGNDIVNYADTGGQVRLRFTSSEVGNGDPNESNTQANQDGGLAVRSQTEGPAGDTAGTLSRFDDEGITFVASGTTTFDVRDQVSGVQRGDQFRTVALGTSVGDFLLGTSEADYLNAGQGDDNLAGGDGNDFLVGGAGADQLDGGDGDDSFIGGGGDDFINGGVGLQDTGVDRAIFNVTTDGADTMDLGGGMDVVTVNANAATNVRLTFTSAEVGDGSVFQSNTMPNQDGDFALRLQAEDGTGTPGTEITRTDDEGITFVGGAGVTFDVRDLVSGAARGELFEVVMLGTDGADDLAALQESRPYYINGGAGDDEITGGSANDFLVGGGGNDILSGRAGNDSFIGGGGNDSMNGGAGIDNMTGGAGNDVYFVDVAGDIVIEAIGGGNDRLIASASYQLADGQDVETLDVVSSGATTAINLRGNDYNQTLLGNQGNNVLNGDGGKDVMVGYGGNDTYFVDNNNDRVTENTNGGNDRVIASVSYALTAGVEIERIETLSTTSTNVVNLTGNEVGQFVLGNNGSTTLNGKGGNDTLTGYLGEDAFLFDTALGANNVDTITDFSILDDVILLNSMTFTNVGPDGALAAGAFSANATGMATDADDRIVYNTTTGELFYDADGLDGDAAVQFALLDNQALVTSEDFFVV